MILGEGSGLFWVVYFSVVSSVVCLLFRCLFTFQLFTFRAFWFGLFWAWLGLSLIRFC